MHIKYLVPHPQANGFDWVDDERGRQLIDARQAIQIRHSRDEELYQPSSEAIAPPADSPAQENN